MNRKIKALAPYGVGLLAILGVVAAPQAAQAHDGGITATCTSLSANLSNYPAGSTIGGTLDGVDLGTSTFGPSFSQTATLDPAVPHSWSITVTSGDGDPRYSFTSAGSSDPSCIPVVEEPPVVVPPVEPPVVVPPVEPPTEEPPVVVPPVTEPVVEPRIQDYITCAGAAFVLDNTGSSQPVTYEVNGVLLYHVQGGLALHTDTDGTIIAPVDGQYVVEASDGSRWVFAATPAEDCPVVVPPTEEPLPPVDEPTTPVEPTTPIEEPTTPVTPVTPEAPVAEVTPVAPTLVADAAEDAAPLRITAVDEEAVADGSLAYTGSDATTAWTTALGALGVALLGLAVLLVARRRQVAAEQVEVDEIN